MKPLSHLALRVLAGLGLLLVLVACGVLFVAATATGTRWALAGMRPLVNGTAGMSLQWQAVEGTLLTGLRIDGFTFASSTATGRIEVGIQRLAFAWQPLRLLDGTLALSSLQVDGLNYASDSTTDTASEPLTAAKLQELLFAAPVGVELQGLDIGAVQLRFNDSSFAFDALTGAATLDADGLQLSQLAWQQGPTRVSGAAELAATLAVQGDLAWQTRLGELDYAGNLNVGGSLQRLELNHALGQPLQAQSGGTVVPGMFAGETLALDLRHSFDVLDLTPFGQPGIRLQQGEITTTGSPTALAIDGSLAANIENFEVLNLAFSLGYQPQALALDTIRIEGTQISLGASGSLLLEPLSLDLDWELARLDSGTSLPVQLSDVNGAGSIELVNTAGSLDATLVLTRLQGLLNTYPLAIAGNVEVVDSQLASLNLQASSADNTVSVSGSALPMLDLSWQLQAPALAQLWQGLAGTLAGQGTVTGTLEVPEVNGQLNGQELRLVNGDSTMALQSINLQASYSNAANAIRLNLGPFTMLNNAEGQVAGPPLLQRAAVTLTGTLEQHVLTVALVAPQGDLDLNLQGALSPQGAANEGDWQGTLRNLGVQSIYGDWQLEAPAALAYVGGNLALSESCWSYASTRFCLQADKPAAAGFNADLDLSGLPLEWLNPAAAAAVVGTAPVPAPVSASSAARAPKPSGVQQLQDAHAINLPQNLRMEGSLGFELAVRNLSGTTWDSLDLQILPVSPVLQVTQEIENEEGLLVPMAQRFDFHDNTLRASSSAGVWNAELAFQVAREAETGAFQQGGFRGDVQMSDSGDLDGDLDFAFSDVEWLETLAPMLRNPAGTLYGTAIIGGTKSSPQLTSQLQLQNGGFELPDYGLAFTEIELLLKSASNNDIDLDFSAHSGDGTLALTASITNPLQDNRAVSAELTGTDFLAYNVDYARVAISPQLQLGYAESAITINGRVEVPRMELDLATLLGDVGTSAVAVSRDVVVVRTDAGEDTPADQQRQSLPLTANVTLALGDAVKLRGFGLDASLTGQLSLEQAPNRPVLVYGELVIPEGSYEIYNQALSTRDGRVMFFGNPANPVVDIRAFRETSTAEVGMLLSGNINNMQGQLYSTPTLPESEILAMLVTGKSFNNVNNEDSDALLGAIANFGFERGQGLTNAVSSKLGLDSVTVGGDGALRESSLGLGKYITPDLLMSYKVGLFDRQSVLSIDYNLTEHLKLQVETGLSQSVDISYTIEKD